MNRFFFLLSVAAAVFIPSERLSANESFDVVVYGGTSAGVISAVQAKKMGKTVIIVGPDKHLGGLSSGGLGMTDSGRKEVIGGLALDFYHRIWKEYQKPENWKFEQANQFKGKGQGIPAVDSEAKTMWLFEPHIAEKVFEDYVKEFSIPVRRDEWLDRQKGVKKEGSNVVAITMLSGKTFLGKVFIDATYEGDLMAAAGVDYHVGREANSVYGEQWNGVQTGVLHHGHHFGILKKKISPYVIPEDPTSGLLPRISPDPPGEYGQGDRRVQAYNYRFCATDHAENRIPFPKPEGYDAKQYELMIRIYEAGWTQTFHKFDMIPNRKTDTNNHGPMSTDNIGMNYDYPEASYERRKEILREHRTYQQGWLYFLANDPRVPKELQAEMGKWGLPKDEFLDNEHWPHQIYVREARRMIGKFVMTENELMKKKPTPDSIGMGSYTIDSHNVQRYVTPEGYVQNEGDIGVSIRPYGIAYGALVPKKDQVNNLLVPIAASCSHIAYGSVRMEPVFMILGQSAATAGVIAIDSKIAVQDVAYDQLRPKLLEAGQILEHALSEGPMPKHKSAIDPGKLPGILVDDIDATKKGDWQTSTASSSFVGHGYNHDGDLQNGMCSAVFEIKLPKSAMYEVRMAYQSNANRSSKVKVNVVSLTGSKSITVNQKTKPPIDSLFISLGSYQFSDQQPAQVTISNEGADGYVVIDAIQWLEVK
jgi:FAD dependent oxidoreductase